ncbi:anti-sigma factor family protein [Phytohabitans rumicis]|uniref:Anti-sigma factor n=1 Tax=Phytohabitans rumicis TaxID=1076125 RepID=A0A6V8KYD3_9ACTN|nr:zf-HC2 domain-containing protein [Phytohabitans rumicis]GFJ90122.1 anti-sigma factor [Phytohabitans rumicis]
MRCDYAYDSGAYVLGALTPADRAAYERHLAGCEACREAVGDVAVLPGLLGRLDPAGLEQIASAPPAESRMPDLLAAVSDSRRRERNARRWRTGGSVLAAACLSLFVGLGAGILRDSGGVQTPRVELASMQSLSSGVPVTAEIGLTTTKYGTEITMHCSYPVKNSDTHTYTYRLYAWDSEGDKEQIGSWAVAPGADVSFTGMTSFAVGEIQRIALTKKDGTPLLEYKVP